MIWFYQWWEKKAESTMCYTARILDKRNAACKTCNKTLKSLTVAMTNLLFKENSMLQEQ